MTHLCIRLVSLPIHLVNFVFQFSDFDGLFDQFIMLIIYQFFQLQFFVIQLPALLFFLLSLLPLSFSANICFLSASSLSFFHSFLTFSCSSLTLPSPSLVSCTFPASISAPPVPNDTTRLPFPVSTDTDRPFP